MSLSKLIIPLLLAFGSWRVWTYIFLWETVTGFVWYLALYDFFRVFSEGLTFEGLERMVGYIPETPESLGFLDVVGPYILLGEMVVMGGLLLVFFRRYLRLILEIRRRVLLRFTRI